MKREVGTILLLCLGQVLSLLDSGCSWSTVYEGAALSGYNNLLLTDMTTAKCKEACEAETTFKCRSFEIHKKGDCYLSAADRHTSNLVQWKSYKYYEIQCEDDPRDVSRCQLQGPYSRSTIPAYISFEMEDVHADDCAEECRKHDEFVCRSFIFSKKRKICSLFMVDRSGAALVDSTLFDYYELSCEVEGCPKGQWSEPLENRAIGGYNEVSISGTVDDCKEICQGQTRFRCRSFDYDVERSICYLQRVTRDEEPDSNWNGFKYYELSNCERKKKE